MFSHDSTVRYEMPLGACDAHMHVFGPVARFPGIAGHSYTPRPAPFAEWQRSFGALGVERVVIVQPSCYGTDNTCTLEAVSSVDAQARAVVSINPEIAEADLLTLHQAGARGVRLNAKSVGARDAEAIAAQVRKVAGRIAPYGWHVQLHAESAVITEMSDALHTLACPVVIDHMGGMRIPIDDGDPHAMQDLLRGGNCWVKLSAPYRIVDDEKRFAETLGLADALISANPAHVVWGSDWPHTAEHAGRPQSSPQEIAFRDIQPRSLVQLLMAQCRDEQTFVRILADNPAALYGFQA